TVTRIDVDLVADDAVSGGMPASTGWTTLSDVPTRIDLFDATSTHVLLAGLAVPTGRIEQIRLVLDPNPTYVAADGTTSNVACPSCGETGIKVVTRGMLVVAPAGVLDVTLDFTSTFDAARNRLDPVIVLGDVRS